MLEPLRAAERAKAGDLEAFGSLVHRYQKLVFATAYRISNDVEASRDIAQDVFLRAFVKLDQLKNPAKFGPWIRQITVNESRAWLANNPFSLPLEPDSVIIDPVNSLDTGLTLDSALATLDEVSRVTLAQFYIYGSSMRDIADYFDEPLTTVKSRLRNARAKLRRQLEGTLNNESTQPGLEPEFTQRVTRLLAAVQAGNEEETQELLKQEPRLVASCEQSGRQTPLHIAAAAGSTALVELLLSYGADPNALDEGDNASPLHHAAERGRVDAVKLLVEAGANVNWDLTVHLLSPLGWAVVLGEDQPEVAAYLISKGADVDLFSAIALDRGDLIESMVKENPRRLKQRMSSHERHRSPIEFAMERRKPKIAQLLVDFGSEIGFSEAATLGMSSKVKSRLREGVSDWLVNEALKSSVLAAQIGSVEILLKAGADPNYAPQGTSLLFDSISIGDREVAELLIRSGADMEFKDPQWNSGPLGWQVFFGKPKAVRLAIELGATLHPHLFEVAKSGQEGQLRRWSPATRDNYGEVLNVLNESRE